MRKSSSDVTWNFCQAPNIGLKPFIVYASYEIIK